MVRLGRMLQIWSKCGIQLISLPKSKVMPNTKSSVALRKSCVAAQNPKRALQPSSRQNQMKNDKDAENRPPNELIKQKEVTVVLVEDLK